MSLFADGDGLDEQEELLLAQDLRAWIFSEDNAANEGDSLISAGRDPTMACRLSVLLPSNGPADPILARGAMEDSARPMVKSPTPSAARNALSSLLDPLPPPATADGELLNTSTLAGGSKKVAMARVRQASIGMSRWDRAYSACSLILSDALMDFMDLELPTFDTVAASGGGPSSANPFASSNSGGGRVSAAPSWMEPGWKLGGSWMEATGDPHIGGPIMGEGRRGGRIRGLSLQLEAGGLIEPSSRLSALGRSLMSSLDIAFRSAEACDDDILMMASIPELAAAGPSTHPTGIGSNAAGGGHLGHQRTFMPPPACQPGGLPEMALNVSSAFMMPGKPRLNVEPPYQAPRPTGGKTVPALAAQSNGRRQAHRGAASDSPVSPWPPNTPALASSTLVTSDGVGGPFDGFGRAATAAPVNPKRRYPHRPMVIEEPPSGSNASRHLMSSLPLMPFTFQDDSSASAPSATGELGQQPRQAGLAPKTQQEAYAAAANRLLWRLGLLGGGSEGAPPADPHDNDLCNQLSTLLSGLDGGVSECLRNVGVDEGTIGNILSGDI